MSIISSPEPKAHQWVYSIARHPSSTLFKHFLFRNPLANQSNFIWWWNGIGERKFVQMVQVTLPRWPQCPYMMVKTFIKKSSSEPNGQYHWNLVYSIEHLSTTKFVQMMTPGWPLTFLCKGQICFLKLLYGKTPKQWNFRNYCSLWCKTWCVL